MTVCCGHSPANSCRCYTDAEAVAESIRAYVRRRVRHAQDAEDVTQEALLRIYRGVDALRTAAALEGWMYRVAANAIADHHRRSTRQALPLDPVDLDTDPVDPEDEPSAASQLAGCVGTLLGRLPDDYRQALELTDLGDLTQQEAAVEVGLSSSGMKSRVQRGRRLLRAEVRRCCEVTLDSQGALHDVALRDAPEGPACAGGPSW